jgi:hypothetical protein
LAREQLDGPTPGRIGERGERVVDPFDPCAHGQFLATIG